jgi:hypothetical protein
MLTSKGLEAPVYCTLICDVIVKSSLGQVFATAGSVSQVLSGSPNGETGYRDGRLDEALFHNPKSFTTDDAGNIYVADTRNFALRKVSIDTGMSSSFTESESVHMVVLYCWGK